MRPLLTAEQRAPYQPPCHITWQGVTLAIHYTPCWFAMPGYETAHLEVRSIMPEGHPLPFTDTGYRSCFLPAEAVEAIGDASAYVLAWLEEAAQSPAWQHRVRAERQLTLF